MTTLLENLNYLRQEAFEFSLEINPHAGCHETLADHFSFGSGDNAEDWVAPEQRAEAYRTGHFVEGRVYPSGSVSFYTLRGNDIEAIVTELARLCREDQARYRANGYDPKASRAFASSEIQEGES